MTLSKTRKAVLGAKDIGVIAALSLTFALGGPVFNRIQDTRTYRDITRTTPFHSVKVQEVSVLGDALTVSGTMKKRRCQRLSVVFYTAHRGKALVPARFETLEAEETPENRPPSEVAQVFGPWRIISRISDPDYAYMFVTHECEEGLQTNRFFKLAWVDKGD